MGEIKWGGGKQGPGIVKNIKSMGQIVDTGTVLAIDPASKSLGYALYDCGVLVEKGKLISKYKQIERRLRDLSRQLKNKFKRVDILAVEKIRGSMAHEYLRWSIGMAVTSIDSDVMVEIPINFWKKLVEEGYTKDDDNDAELIGLVVVKIAGTPKDVKRKKRSYKCQKSKTTPRKVRR